MISPSILIWGSLSFTIALMLHILIWRSFRPARQMAWLFTIFLILPFLTYLAIFLATILTTDNGPGSFPSTGNLLFSFIWHAALSCGYIMTYPPIQAGCPSLKIVLLVSQAMPRGLSAGEINRRFSEDALFSQRFDDLVKDGLVAFKYDAWGITLSGKLLSRFFLVYRRLLKLPLGEG